MNSLLLAMLQLGCCFWQFLCAYEVARVMFTEIQLPKSMKLVYPFLLVMCPSILSICHRFDDLMEAYFRCLLCAPFMLFLACILIFNSWFNFTAELTRFADREFYQVQNT